MIPPPRYQTPVTYRQGQKKETMKISSCKYSHGSRLTPHASRSSIRVQRSTVPPTTSPPPNAREEGALIHPLRLYAITKHISFWHLTFNGQKAVFDHEQGAY